MLRHMQGLYINCSLQLADHMILVQLYKRRKGYEYYGNNFKDIDAIIEHHKKRPEAMLCCLNNHCSRY